MTKTVAGRFAPSVLDPSSVELVEVWDDAPDSPDPMDGEVRRHYTAGLVPEARERGGLNRCTMCGVVLRYIGVCVLTTTGEYFVVGRDCAENLEIAAELGRKVSGLRANASHHRENLKIAHRREEFLTENPDVADALTLSARSEFIEEIDRALQLYGDLTDGQASGVVHAAQRIREDDEWAKLPTAMVPAGRAVVTGQVLGTRQERGFHHYSPDVTKVLVRDDRGFKVWGTMPRELIAAGADRGARVTFTATLKSSATDHTFGLFSRPTKAELLTAGDTSDLDGGGTD